MKKVLLAILAIIFSLSVIPLSACRGEYADAEKDAVYTVQDAVLEVAYAYYRQGAQTNYSQTMCRRNINPSPEEATSQHMMFLDCSSFVNAVMYEALGINVMPYETTEKSPQTKNFLEYAKENTNNADVIGVWLRENYIKPIDKDNAMAEAMSKLQVGDVINYRKTGAGHAVMYVGDNMLIHSTGKDFKLDADNPEKSHEGIKENKGGVGLIKIEELFSIYGDRYMFQDGYEGFCIIRPTERKATVTEETHARMLSKELDSEKTADIGVNTSLAVGEKITYTLTIKNHRDVGYKNVEIKDVLDDNLEFVSGSKGVSHDGQNVSFKKNIKAGETITISWTAKVKSSATFGTVIVSDKTTVAGVGQATIKTSVSKYTNEQLISVANKAKEYASQNKVFANPIDMVEQLYNDALNVNLFDYEKVSLALSDVIEEEGFNLKDTAIASLVAPDMYGGQRDTALTGLYKNNKDIVRLITKDNLSVGDVIIAEKDSGVEDQVAYVYVGDMQLVSCMGKNKGEVKLVNMSESQYESSHVLVSIFAYNRYAVIRPSMAK